MKPSSYRDMSLLQEVTQTPSVTQRELAKRIGIALGLTNLMLRRLVKKGYIKISGTKRSRIRYLITPQGILEKSRLTYEFIQYSHELYSGIRRSLREQLAILVRTGHRKILLWGTGELAEIAYLGIQETGLELVGVVDEVPDRERFLGYPVQSLEAAVSMDSDRIIVASLRGGESGVQRLVALGVPLDRLIILPIPTLQGILPEGDVARGARPAQSEAPATETAAEGVATL